MGAGEAPELLLNTNRLLSPTVIPPMLAAVPLFWTKKVLPMSAVIPPAPTKPSGFEVPLFVASNVSRPVKLGFASSCLRIDPLVTQIFGALNNKLPARVP